MSLFTLSGTGSAYKTGNSLGTETPANSPFASLGTYGFGSAGGNSVLTSNAINTSSYTSTQLSFKLAAFNGLEATDRIFVEVSPDNGTTWYNTLTVTGFSGAFWAYSATATASTNFDGDSATATFSAQFGAYSTVQINNLPSVSQLKIRINMISDATTEWWVIDNLNVTGRTASYVSPYADFSVSGTTQALTGLTNNTTYYYRVRAVGTFFSSISSNTISATTLNGSPEISNPTVTGVTNNSAVLGAEVVSFGADASLTARGTAYSTTSGSVTATSNAEAEGGLTLGAYTQSRTGLSPQTRYYFKGYASNVYGTRLTNESSFITLSNAPETAVSGLTAAAFSGSQINLSWTSVAVPTGASQIGYVVLYSQDPTTPAFAGVNGQGPVAGANTSIATTTTSATASVIGLAGSTAYQFVVIPFAWNGTDSATIHYLTIGATSANATTFGAINALPATNLTFNNVSCSSFVLNWTNGDGADGVLILRTVGTTTPNTAPSTGVNYSIGNTIGNAEVVYVGSDSTFTASGLADNTNHQYSIYTYKVVDLAIGYLTSTPLNGSQTTASLVAPVANSASSIDTSSFQANWQNVDCATGYNLYVYTNNAGYNVAAWTFPYTGTSAISDTLLSNSNNIGNNRFSVVPSTSISSVGGVSTFAASTNTGR